MKKIILFLMLALISKLSYSADIAPYEIGQTLSSEQASELQLKYKNRQQQSWKGVPLIETLKNHAQADQIKYGLKLIDETAHTIGPNVKNKKLRYSGNSLNCSSCHLKGETNLPGTKYDGLSLINVANDYPQFRKRGMSIVSAAGRVNGCMTRSMGDGKPLPLDSKEMLAILAYFDWLADGTDKHKSMQGSGVPKVKFPDRQANVNAGQKVYEANCIACHAKSALGTPSENGSYIFPPLAGAESFNNGAGMSRLKKATQFIHANMPLGVSSNAPVLSVDQAYDVAAYMLSLPREMKKARDKDFPNANFRPEDYPVPAYFNGDKAQLKKAKLGPFKN